MSPVVRVAARLARAWVSLYTARMPAELRDRRSAEVASDLWDHHADAREGGRPPLTTALEIVLRTCLGVPDDVSWRIEARSPTPTGRRFTMELTPRQTRWMGIVSVAGGAILLLLYGIVPTVSSYFATVGIPLPLPTRIVMRMSAVAFGYWWAVAAGVVALVLVLRRLEGALVAKLAAGSDGQSDVAADALWTKLEPVMIVGLGVVVGFMVLAMFLPIFDVVNATQ